MICYALLEQEKNLKKAVLAQIQVESMLLKCTISIPSMINKPHLAYVSDALNISVKK